MKQKVRRKDMTEKILTKSLLLTLLIGISTYPISARALDCTATPDCASMGYAMSAADCTDKPTVKCPTDTSKVFCKKEPKPVTCAVGSVLGNDKKCYSAGNLPSTVKPIGVVFDHGIRTSPQNAIETTHRALGIDPIGDIIGKTTLSRLKNMDYNEFLHKYKELVKEQDKQRSGYGRFGTGWDNRTEGYHISN